MLFKDSKRLFMQRCLAKNLSDNTLTTYEYFFRSVERSLDSQGITEVQDITPDVLRKYFIDMCRINAGMTVEGYYVRFKTYLNFLFHEGHIPYNPIKSIDSPKVPKRLIPSFSSQEVHKMLSAYDTNDFIGRRNYTILCLLLATGMRRSEFLSLTLLDVSLKNNFIRVIGKGDKERLIPIGKALAVVLKRYLQARQEYLKGYTDTPYLFITKYRKQMCKETSNTIFRNLRIDLHLTGKRFSAHVWRHTFAKAFLLNGGDVFTLQELLGHSDVETTRVYVSLTDTEKAIQHRKFNPLDNHKWEYY